MSVIHFGVRNSFTAAVNLSAGRTPVGVIRKLHFVLGEVKFARVQGDSVSGANL